LKKSSIAPVVEMSFDDQITEESGTKSAIQTMLRATSTSQIKLSEMADTKANILISVNSIIISLILTIMLPSLQEESYYTIPTLIFLSATVSTIIVAIIAIRPNLNRGTFRIKDIEEKKTNLLFFGNFHRMSLQHYESAMRMMMKDPDYLYRSMLKDTYYLGLVLAKKYRRVRLAYNIFMAGLIVSIIAFTIASFR